MSLRGIEIDTIITDEWIQVYGGPPRVRNKLCPLCRRVPRDEGAAYCNWCWGYLESFRQEIERAPRPELASNIAALYTTCQLAEPYYSRHLEYLRLTRDFPAQALKALDQRSPVYDWLLWIIVDLFTRPEGLDGSMIRSLQQGHIIPFEIWYDP